MAKDEKEQEMAQESLRVVDRRRFNADGTPLARQDPAATHGPREEGTAKSAPSSGETRIAASQEQAQAGPTASSRPKQESVDFSSFVVSLATQAFIMMGQMPNPETGLTVKNIEAARQTIDILDMLEKKTQGNLSKEEANLMEEILASLRLAFVNTVRDRQVKQ